MKKLILLTMALIMLTGSCMAAQRFIAVRENRPEDVREVNYYLENGGKIIINEWAKVGAHCEINSVKKVEIGRDVSMAKGVIIVDNNSHPICPADRQYMAHTPHGSLERSSQYGTNAPVHIGNNVWIGSYSRICKGVTIGDNSIIGANSVVTHDVPANCIAVGNPARIVKEHIDEFTSPIFPINK